MPLGSPILPKSFFYLVRMVDSSAVWSTANRMPNIARKLVICTNYGTFELCSLSKLSVSR